MYRFTTNHEGFSRVNKTKARKLYNTGADIYIVPHNVRLFNNLWVQPVVINKSSERSFDSLIGEFTMTECNAELGKYPAYYIANS